jgi:hypothetical protein
MSVEKIVQLQTAEEKLIEELTKVIETFDEYLTVNQVCGCLFSVAHDQLAWARQDE